ncbi:50S ribosomal protein L33 [Candidatus Daviesbacteria bacterium]|nr:50S ribosomal protein L33 [Candidatus Daviesbacteria bacterium]
MAKSARVIINLECTVCKSRNYVTSKNPTNTKDKITLKKFCSKCRKQTEHKETKSN